MGCTDGADFETAKKGFCEEMTAELQERMRKEIFGGYPEGGDVSIEQVFAELREVDE